MNPHRVLPEKWSIFPGFDARVAGGLLLTLSVGGGCRMVAPEGTSVGNPGKGVLRIGRGDDVRIRSAQMPVSALKALDCGGDGWTLGGPSTVDLLSGLHFGLPKEEVCGLAVTPAGVLRVEGVALQGEASFGLTLPIADFSLTESWVRADRQVFLLGQPGWLSTDLLGITGPGNVEIGPGDPRYSQIRAALLTNVTFGAESSESVTHEDEGQFICNDEEGGEREWEEGEEEGSAGAGWDCWEASERDEAWADESREAEDTGGEDTGEGDTGEGGGG
jgi:hypothetical protein